MEKRSIAIIEDDIDLLSSYADVLSADYQLALFSHPREFLDYIDKNQKTEYHAVITDYTMPQINGVEMIKLLREKGKDYPIILISAFLTKETIRDGLSAGIVKFIDKPFTVQDVAASLDQLATESQIRAINNQVTDISLRIQEINSALKVIFETHFDADFLKEMFVDRDGHSQGMAEAVSDLQTKFDNLIKDKNSLIEHLHDANHESDALKKAA